MELERRNPFTGLKVVAPVDEDDNGVSFEYGEVRTLLGKTGSINDELQDIVRILACTGARLAEISGLQVKDFDTKAQSISIEFNDIRRLKNKASIRVVPVVDAKALEALRKRAEGRPPAESIFPKYGWDKGANSASAALSQRLTTIGLRDPRSAKPKTTHSLRHTFKDALRDVGVLDDIRNMIHGHTAGDEASKYGSNELLERKREAAEKVWKLYFKKPQVSRAILKTPLLARR
ncbi:tyrosine-type recombinase/integrase [Bradyrhizobium liaoningense]|uniref:tyrosine-type recombinase/integrase n=1 Tax=Bradyrhizobium liaoningense TaxID=43992 RepID=UPI001BA77F58|nr:tyrosine-type recombinase/integrase [Bradyrhizobium liaoningense]MBR0715808.1 tyrosine-type recombinase/integrase [Bradyrhizobium liaoningense]